jgi:hypothetical protein
MPFTSALCPDDRARGCRPRPRIEGASAHASPRSRLCAANKGHDTRGIQGWLGHRSITSTAIYTALAPNRFKDSGETELPRRQLHAQQDKAWDLWLNGHSQYDISKTLGNEINNFKTGLQKNQIRRIL